PVVLRADQVGLAAREHRERKSEWEWQYVHRLLLSAAAVAGHAPAAGSAALWVRTLGDLLEKPGVGGDACVLGGRVDDRLQRFREAKGDAGAEAVVRRGHRGALLLDVEELGIPAGDSHFDVAVRELIGQLRGGLAEHVHQAEPEGWLQGCRDSASGVGNRVVAHTGDGFEIPLECFDEGRHVHGRHYDITVMSRQAYNGVTSAST